MVVQALDRARIYKKMKKVYRDDAMLERLIEEWLRKTREKVEAKS